MLSLFQLSLCLWILIVLQITSIFCSSHLANLESFLSDSLHHYVLSSTHQSLCLCNVTQFFRCPLLSSFWLQKFTFPSLFFAKTLRVLCLYFFLLPILSLILRALSLASMSLLHGLIKSYHQFFTPYFPFLLLFLPSYRSSWTHVEHFSTYLIRPKLHEFIYLFVQSLNTFFHLHLWCFRYQS